MIRVMVADDQVLVRSGFAALLRMDPDLEVVAEASNGREAVELAREHRPDVVLMDIRMPGLDGLAATREIRADPQLGTVKIVVLTTFELDEYVQEALRIGASGFLVKHTDPDQLVHAVKAVAAGDAMLSPSVTRRLIDALAGQPEHAVPMPDPKILETLTEREREVVELVAQGLSNDEIAARWFVSPATVRTHVSRAMTKLYARDRAHLVVLAYRHGLTG